MTKAELETLKKLEKRLTNVAHAFYVNGKRSSLQEALEGWKDDIKPARKIIFETKGN